MCEDSLVVWVLLGCLILLCRREVSVGTKKILLSRVLGKIFATSHLCPHYKASLVKGMIHIPILVYMVHTYSSLPGVLSPDGRLRW